MKRILLFLLALAILVPTAVIGVDVLLEPGSSQASVPAPNAADEITRGRYLVTAGNCLACHTTRGGNEFAGGRAIATAFGTIHTSNITPDAETGIGAWTSDDFWRALHNGKSKDGSFLYPAFPYTSYTKVTRADSDAMFAYLRTIAPVRQQNKEHELRFPYNLRPLLAFWRALYFTPGEYQPQPAQGDEWNRGAYLVQGLGHCSACHSSRTALGGSIAEHDLAGGSIPLQGWHAPSLTADAETGLGEWDAKDIADLLKTGVSQRGSVYGPMAEVVGGSLQHMSDADINAMASYLKSLPGHGTPGTPVRQHAVHVAEAADTVLKRGASLYETHCSACHKANGQGVPPAYPPLAGNRSMAAGPALNPIRIVLNGGYAPSTQGNPRPYGMPPFSATLSDEEIAAVVSFVRNAWGNKGTLVSPVDVGRLRGAPIE